jgi:hypothetical protein
MSKVTENSSGEKRDFQSCIKAWAEQVKRVKQRNELPTWQKDPDYWKNLYRDLYSKESKLCTPACKYDNRLSEHSQQLYVAVMALYGVKVELKKQSGEKKGQTVHTQPPPSPEVFTSNRNKIATTTKKTAPQRTPTPPHTPHTTIGTPTPVSKNPRGESHVENHQQQQKQKNMEPTTSERPDEDGDNQKGGGNTGSSGDPLLNAQEQQKGDESTSTQIQPSADEPTDLTVQSKSSGKIDEESGAEDEGGENDESVVIEEELEEDENKFNLTSGIPNPQTKNCAIVAVVGLWDRIRLSNNSTPAWWSTPQSTPRGTATTVMAAFYEGMKNFRAGQGNIEDLVKEFAKMRKGEELSLERDPKTGYVDSSELFMKMIQYGVNEEVRKLFECEVIELSYCRSCNKSRKVNDGGENFAIDADAFLAMSQQKSPLIKRTINYICPDCSTALHQEVIDELSYSNRLLVMRSKGEDLNSLLTNKGVDFGEKGSFSILGGLTHNNNHEEAFILYEDQYYTLGGGPAVVKQPHEITGIRLVVLQGGINNNNNTNEQHDNPTNTNSKDKGDWRFVWVRGIPPQKTFPEIKKELGVKEVFPFRRENNKRTNAVVVEFQSHEQAKAFIEADPPTFNPFLDKRWAWGQGGGVNIRQQPRQSIPQHRRQQQPQQQQRRQQKTKDEESGTRGEKEEKKSAEERKGWRKLMVKEIPSYVKTDDLRSNFGASSISFFCRAGVQYGWAVLGFRTHQQAKQQLDVKQSLFGKKVPISWYDPTQWQQFTRSSSTYEHQKQPNSKQPPAPTLRRAAPPKPSCSSSPIATSTDSAKAMKTPSSDPPLSTSSSPTGSPHPPSSPRQAGTPTARIEKRKRKRGKKSAPLTPKQQQPSMVYVIGNNGFPSNSTKAMPATAWNTDTMKNSFSLPFPIPNELFRMNTPYFICYDPNSAMNCFRPPQ